MRVLWVMNKELDTASDKAYISELAQALKVYNIETKIIARYKKEKIIYNADIEYLSTPSIKFIKQAAYLIKILIVLPNVIKTFKPEIIVADRPTLAYPFWFIIKRLKRKKVKSIFVSDVRSLPNNIIGMSGKINLLRFRIGLKIASRCFDKCLTITDGLSNYIQKNSKFKAEDIGIWSSAFNDQLFNPLVIKNELIFKQNKFNIIYHGAIAGNRNLKELVESMLYTPKNFHLNLLGEGALLTELKEVVSKMELENKITFYPSVLHKNVPKYLLAADAGIVPIPDTLWFNVSSPIKLLEYMAMGLPIIAPETAPIKHVAQDIADIEYYDLATLNLPKEIGAAFNRAYKRWNLNYYSETNRKLVIEKFTWQSQASAINSFFHKIFNTE